jgi:hypothetical protein
VRGVVNYRLCEIEIALGLIIVTICKSTLNPISIPDLVLSYS